MGNFNDCMLAFMLGGSQPVRGTAIPLFDGSGTFATLPVINFSGDFWVEFSFNKTSVAGGGAFMICSRASDYGFNVYTTGDWNSGNGQLRILPDANILATGLGLDTHYKIRFEYTGGNLIVYLDDVETFNGAFTLPPQISSSTNTHIARREQGDFRHFGSFYNYSDSNGNAYWFNDGWANNPLLASQGTGGDGTFFGMYEGAWGILDTSVPLIPQTRLAPSFNGVSQKASFSDITINAGDTIQVTCSKPQSDFQTVFESFAGSFRLRRGSSGTIQITGFTGTVNGQVISDGSTIWPDGISEFVLTRGGGTSDYINSLGSRSSLDVWHFEGLIYNFKVNEGLTYNFPMDDGWADNPIMRNAAEPLGVDIKSAPSSLDQGWSEIEPNKYEINGTNSSPSFITFSSLLDLDSRYLIEFRIYDHVKGTVKFGSPTGSSDSFSGEGSYKTLFDSGSSSAIIIQAFDRSSEFKIEIISIKKANGYGEFIDMTETSWVEVNE